MVGGDRFGGSIGLFVAAGNSISGGQANGIWPLKSPNTGALYSRLLISLMFYTIIVTIRIMNKVKYKLRL